MSFNIISNKSKGFWKGILLWLLGVRHWELAEDFNYIKRQRLCDSAGFTFDGASILNFASFFTVGVLLMGGLVHDYAYKYESLLMKIRKKLRCYISKKSRRNL